MNMNNIVIDYNGTKLSIAQHKMTSTSINSKFIPNKETKTVVEEIALIDVVDETGDMPIYHYGSDLDSLISTLTKIKKDLDEGKYN